ncbi:MFS transporter [Aquibium carbonis]|uniref:MFS transporter n=1 Tax=Aquibium carbonis TaxID=2495581 RepID=A0A3S0AR07_9HYPH|nr:MFS transporter [Aquibium carbonis]RST85030.1 MFS transporter [Aquibium carbonis]
MPIGKETGAPGQERAAASPHPASPAADARPDAAAGSPLRVAAMSGLLTGLGYGFVQMSVSALLKPIALDLSLSRSSVSAAISIGALLQGAVALFAGYAADRLNARGVVIAGTIVMAIGLLAMSSIEGPVGLYLVWGVLVAGGASCAFTVVMDRAVLLHSDDRRGISLAVRFTAVAVTTTLQMPVIVLLIETVGWRATCVIWAVLMLLTLPAAAFLFTARPREVGGSLLALSQSATLREAVRSPFYWALAFAYMATTGAASGVTVHAVAMLTDRGWSAMAAGSIVGALVLLSIPSRLVTGHFSDRQPARRLPRFLAAVLIVESVCFLADAGLQTGASLFVLLFAKGIATGVPTVLIVVIAITSFGKDSVGAIQGSLLFLIVPGTMAGPFLAGLAFDRTGSYASAIAFFGVVILLAGAILLFVRPLPVRHPADLREGAPGHG